MFSIHEKTIGHFKTPLARSFTPAAHSSGTSTLHFFYKLKDLQREIEKRTFYLGKFRKSEEAPHLLDLIGMSTDEGDLLYSYINAAMADVYDDINKHTLHIAKDYVFKTHSAQDVITLKAVPQPTINSNLNTNTQLNFTINPDGASATLAGSITFQSTDVELDEVAKNYTKYDLHIDVELDYTTEATSLITGTQSTPTHVLSYRLNEACLSFDSVNNLIIIMPQIIEFDVAPQTPFVSNEVVTSVAFKKITGISVTEKAPTKLNALDVVDYNGTQYVVKQDTDSSSFDVARDFEPLNTAEDWLDGIHYYLEIPNFINETHIHPLDNAILEALCNRVIFKWLVNSYPEESPTFNTMYEQALDTIKTRCLIFNRHWLKRNPRIY